MRRTLLGLSLLILSSGCHSVAFEDSVDLDLDFTPVLLPLAARADAIHDPYVTGAKVDVWAVSDHGDDDTSGWTMTSDNPAVFTLGKRSDLGKGQIAIDHCIAGQPGTATLVVRDQASKELRRRSITVLAPDSAVLLSHGPMLLRRPDAEASTDSARVLVGGTATFEVRWFSGTTELRGNGALSASAPAGVMVSTPQTFLFEERDWLQVTPIANGPASTVVISAGGQTVRTFTVEPVDAAQVAGIRVRGMDESKASKGEWLVALAEGLDASSATILGIEYGWDIDGAQQQGLGDLYRYQFDPAVPKMLTATFVGNQASATIHWGGGYVDSTNRVGCSVGHGSPRTLAPLVLVALAALAGRARARRRRAARR